MQTLFDHNFSDAHRTWLECAATTLNFNPRNARAHLFEKLPADFNPSNIDSRFYRNSQITVMGRRLFNPSDPIFQNSERVALAVRNEIRRNPGMDEISLDRIAELSELPKPQTYMALVALDEVSPLFTGSTSESSRDGPVRYFLTGPHGYDAALSFTTLDSAMERLYRIQGMPFGRPLLDTTEDSDSFPSKPTRRQKSASTTTKRSTAFVIMAMNPQNPDLADILDTIRTVCDRFGIKAHRADEIQHQDQITNIILDEIRNCEYLIADLTHERPNVYYEVGYAHALNKKPILYRKIGTAIHFDLAVHNVPEYKNNIELRDLLTKRLEAILGRTAA